MKLVWLPALFWILQKPSESRSAWKKSTSKWHLTKVIRSTAHCKEYRRAKWLQNSLELGTDCKTKDTRALSSWMMAVNLPCFVKHLKQWRKSTTWTRSERTTKSSSLLGDCYIANYSLKTIIKCIGKTDVIRWWIKKAEKRTDLVCRGLYSPGFCFSWLNVLAAVPVSTDKIHGCLLEMRRMLWCLDLMCETDDEPFQNIFDPSP